MAVLSDNALANLATNGLVEPFNSAHLSPCSIDLTLGNRIKVESLDDHNSGWVEMDITEPYFLRPKEFVLASTAETVSIPESCSGQILLRSSAARAGYQHSLAGWLDPGFTGEVTLEICNQLLLHTLPLQAGQRLLQLIIFSLDAPPARSYSVTGNYQNQTGPTLSNLNF